MIRWLHRRPKNGMKRWVMFDNTARAPNAIVSRHLRGMWSAKLTDRWGHKGEEFFATFAAAQAWCVHMCVTGFVEHRHIELPALLFGPDGDMKVVTADRREYVFYKMPRLSLESTERSVPVTTIICPALRYGISASLEREVLMFRAVVYIAPGREGLAGEVVRSKLEHLRNQVLLAGGVKGDRIEWPA